MAFIRSKKVNGKRYYYLVQNSRVNGKVVQRVLKYLGRHNELIKLLRDIR